MAQLLGQRFDHRHAAGVTRYQVDREHRDAGYFECVAVRAVSGSHHFIGGIQVFSGADIQEAVFGAYTCWNCGAQARRSQPHACDANA